MRLLHQYGARADITVEALSCADAATVKTFIELGSDVEEKEQDGSTALYAAIGSEREGLVGG